MKHVLQSLATKVALLLAAMGATTAITIVVANRALEETVLNLEVLTDQRLSELAASDAVIAGATSVMEDTFGLLLAPDAATLSTASDIAFKTTKDLRPAISILPADAQVNLDRRLIAVVDALAEVRTARFQQFRSQNDVAEALNAIYEIGDALTRDTGNVAATQVFNLRSGGNDTVYAVEEGLELLVNERFAALQLAYQLRSAARLASGYSIALSVAKDPALLAILSDLGSESTMEMREVLRDAQAFDYPIVDPDIVLQTTRLYESLIRDPGAFGERASTEVLRAQALLDRELLERIDDEAFSLVLEGEQVSENNSDAIYDLLDGPVAEIQALGALDAAIAGYMRAVLGIAVATTPEELDQAQDSLVKRGFKLRSHAETQSEEIRTNLLRLVEFADPKSGIASLRSKALDARSRAGIAATVASEGVAEIAREAEALASETRNTIVAESAALLQSTRGAEDRFVLIRNATLALFLGAVMLSYLMLVRPVLRLTATTERLASGDLAEVRGFGRSGGEIWRMANALAVFRNGLVEKQRMEREERTTQAAGAGRGRKGPCREGGTGTAGKGAGPRDRTRSPSQGCGDRAGAGGPPAKGGSGAQGPRRRTGCGCRNARLWVAGTCIRKSGCGHRPQLPARIRPAAHRFQPSRGPFAELDFGDRRKRQPGSPVQHGDLVCRTGPVAKDRESRRHTRTDIRVACRHDGLRKRVGHPVRHRHGRGGRGPQGR